MRLIFEYFTIKGGSLAAKGLRCKSKVSTTVMCSMPMMTPVFYFLNNISSIQLLGLSINVRKIDFLYQPSSKQSFSLATICEHNFQTWRPYTHPSPKHWLWNPQPYKLCKCSPLQTESLNCMTSKFKPNSYLIFHKVVFLPTLMFGAETWTTYRRYLKVFGCSDHFILISDQWWLVIMLDKGSDI